MKPGSIFISHRAEYGNVVGQLKKAIESSSRRKIKVEISEDLPGAEKWRAAIKSRLEDAESLLLVYGAPDEDWSWCFYEVGYFAGLDVAKNQSRRIYCIAPPNVSPPGPLDDLQMVTDREKLITALTDIYEKNQVEYDPDKLGETVKSAAGGLFRKLEDFVSYPRVYFLANDADFGNSGDLPATAMLKGDKPVMTQLFGIGRDQVSWNEVVGAPAGDRTDQEWLFFCKWADETKNIILAARQNRFIAPQTVLVVRGGLRYRFLLSRARLQGDGVYCCEFLAINEVGGPALGLSQQQLALLTSIRMGFRFRYEFIKRFATDASELSQEERRVRIQEIPRIIDNLTMESEARGNITLQDLQGAFSDEEAERMGKLVGYWPRLKEALYGSLGLSPEGKRISEGLLGPKLETYKLVHETLRLVNIEFLSLCCARVSRMMKRPDQELKSNAETIDTNVKMLNASSGGLKSAA
jgi:hypothetical protein